LFCHSVVGHFIVFILDICTIFTTVLGNFEFIRAAIGLSAPGAWLSCSSCLDAHAVSLLDVLWANKWLIDWLMSSSKACLCMCTDVETINRLIDESFAAKSNAYCPYSRFPVGAALLCEDGTIFTGMKWTTRNSRQSIARSPCGRAASPPIANVVKLIRVLIDACCCTHSSLVNNWATRPTARTLTKFQPFVEESTPSPLIFSHRRCDIFKCVLPVWSMKVGYGQFRRFRPIIGCHSNIPWAVGQRISDRSCRPINIPVLKIWWKLINIVRDGQCLKYRWEWSSATEMLWSVHITHLISPCLTSSQLTSFRPNCVRCDWSQPRRTRWSDLARHGCDQSQCSRFRWNEVS